MVKHERQRGETDHRLLIDYYKTNIKYEKKTEFNIPNKNHSLNVEALVNCMRKFDFSKL